MPPQSVINWDSPLMVNYPEIFSLSTNFTSLSPAITSYNSFSKKTIMLFPCTGAIAVRSRFFFDLEPSGRSPLSLECARYTADSIDQCERLSQQQCALDEAGVVCQGGWLLTIMIFSTLTTTFALTVLDTPAGNCSNGDIRLAGGRNVLEGRVEICFNNAWGTVCGDTFSSYDAHVVCTSLGLPFNGLLMIILLQVYISKSESSF